MAEDTALTRERELARLRTAVEDTRLDIGNTLNALEQRLSPARLKARARRSLRQATIGKVERMARSITDRRGESGRSFLDSALENPIPLALIGLGAGLLWHHSRRNRERPESSRLLEPEYTPIGYESALVERRASHLNNGASVPHTNGAQHNGHGQLREFVSDVGHRAEELSGRMNGQAPLLGGALALVLGAAAGLVLNEEEHDEAEPDEE